MWASTPTKENSEFIILNYPTIEVILCYNGEAAQMWAVPDR